MAKLPTSGNVFIFETGAAHTWLFMAGLGAAEIAGCHRMSLFGWFETVRDHPSTAVAVAVAVAIVNGLELIHGITDHRISESVLRMLEEILVASTAL